MKRLVSLLLLAAAGLCAQDWAKKTLEASPRHREWIAVRHDGRTVQTFVVYPETKSKAPVVLMIHEIFGLTDWVEDMADQLAAAGYIVVAPDLLSGLGEGGKGTAAFDQESAMRQVSGLPPDQVTADLKAVADEALRFPAATGTLSVAGFCWGGGQAFRFATDRSDIASAFVFYGPPPETASLARIKAPVYGFYAGNDSRIDATLPATKEAMQAAGKTYQPVAYDGAGHGFMRAGEAPGASIPNQKARTEAFERLKTLLAQQKK